MNTNEKPFVCIDADSTIGKCLFWLMATTVAIPFILLWLMIAADVVGVLRIMITGN